MRKLKYYVACSLDGFIAHQDGSFDGFLMEGEAVTDYIESLKNFDVVLMGRKTYETGLKEGKTNPYPMMKSYVFSQTMKESPDEKVELVSENAGKLVRRLKQETGRDIYLCGGGNLATTLFAENLIDEIILKINPFLMGSGIPLFADVIPQTALELTNSRIYDSGIVWLNYEAKH
ncbi:dihydrofolate reductase [Lusitaniella coriacea LEGE 07157]|uniref:Dihydrofolate reductase n=1 Tax=Lusitaniella coriacea LEGE 07157 TaxID=945747 RepID=A0A8J7DWY9_9CYAN|nr:dihydrofolate reductase family protein [Lusitaniella coriacea]MBE9116739.1 dihydrofolate reductase [Lusitaniella coriacea LEGE 07157]